MSDREAALEAELKHAQLKIRLLEEKLDALMRRFYGPKSEQLSPDQLTMLLEDPEGKKDEAPLTAEPEAGAVPKPKARRRSAAARIPEHLPVYEEVLDPEEVKAAPEQWRCIGEEVSEKLDYEPARFLKRRLIRRKYVHKDLFWQAPVIAPLPACMQERCLATPELIAQVVVSKYCDHLPLYRQEQIYQRRHGVTIPRQTLCRWVALAADTLQLVYGQMKRQCQGAAYLQIDETPIHYLHPGAGKALQGYFWVVTYPGGDVIYHWHTSRAARCLEDIMDKDFSGTVQCDGYQAYGSFQKQRAGPIELAGCWAHVRRKFFESRARAPRITGWILGQIGQLYEIEKKLRKARAGPVLRTALRCSQSRPVGRRLKRALMILRSRYLPQSQLGKAIDYTLGHWGRLEVFLQDGRVEIDNNGVENAIRPSKLGAKNWLFIGSEGSGHTSAILISLIESAKRHGLEPYAYICKLLRELPAATNQQIHCFTPAAIAKAFIPDAA